MFTTPNHKRGESTMNPYTDHAGIERRVSPGHSAYSAATLSTTSRTTSWEEDADARARRLAQAAGDLRAPEPTRRYDPTDPQDRERRLQTIATEEFYRRNREAGMSPTDALRHANAAAVRGESLTADPWKLRILGRVAL